MKSGRRGRARAVSWWLAFEAWVGTPQSAVALFGGGLAVFALQSVVLPAHPGRDMGRYVQAYIQLGWAEPILPAVVNTRGPLAALGVGLPLEAGGWAAEIWLGLLYAASILAWGMLAMTFGARAAVLASALLLAYPGYGILFHGLSSDALFAAVFAGWALVLRWAILRPSLTSFLGVGLVTGVLVLVRPGNVVLLSVVVLPLVVRASWGDRFARMAATFVGFALVTQAWRAAAAVRWGDAVTLRPSGLVLATASVLAMLVVLGRRASFAEHRRAAVVVLAAIAVVGVTAAGAAPGVQGPVDHARSLATTATNVFFFRVFEMDRIVAPDNGPASRELGAIVERDLLAEEPYLSYGIDLERFFSSGSDRMFGDVTGLSGTDLPAVTREAIRRHPGAFAGGIAGTLWELLWTRRVFAPGAAVAGGDGAEDADEGGDESSFVVVGGRKLPLPDGDQPIPASRFGIGIRTEHGPAGETWRSATEHPLVFADPRDQRRWERFGDETARLSDRLPVRDGNASAVHRLNQASKAFPPLAVWLLVGIVAMALRRPRHALVALAPAAAGLVIIVATGLVAFSVAHYAAPVSPAFVVLAAAGAVGAHPRGRLPVPGRSGRRSAGGGSDPTTRAEERAEREEDDCGRDGDDEVQVGR